MLLAGRDLGQEGPIASVRMLLSLDVGHRQVAFLLQGHINLLVLGRLTACPKEATSGCGFALLVLVSKLDFLHV